MSLGKKLLSFVRDCKDEESNHSKNSHILIYMSTSVAAILDRHFQGSTAKPTANKRHFGVTGSMPGPIERVPL